MEQPSEEQRQEVVQAIAQIRADWSGVIEATIAASQGNTSAAAQLKPFLNQMEQKADWKTLVNALRRILAGERDPEILLAEIDDDSDILILSDILRGIGVDPRALPPLPGEEPVDDDDGQMLSLEDFLELVTRACKPDAPTGMKDQLLNATQGMVMQANNPPELKQLGRVLMAILAGDRQPDLLSLDPQLIGPVRQILDDIKSQ